MSTITLDELKAKLEQHQDMVLVEALSPQYYRHTHLPGAINVPADQVEALAPQLLPDKSAEIIVYCAGPTCPAAQDAVCRMQALGDSNVRDFKGGKEEWLAAGLPTAGRGHVRHSAGRAAAA